MDTWTFGRKLGVGLLLIGVVLVASTVTTSLIVERVITDKDQIIEVTSANLIRAQKLETIAQRQVAAVRAFALTGDPEWSREARAQEAVFDETLEQIRSHTETQGIDKEREVLSRIAINKEVHEAAYNKLLNTRAGFSSMSAETLTVLDRQFTEEVAPTFERVERSIREFTKQVRAQMAQRGKDSSVLADTAEWISWVGGLFTLLSLTILAFYLIRTLNESVGQATQNIATSATELQTAVRQQASASTEQASVLTEASTTMKESVSISVQIKESAEHVSGMAGECQQAVESGNAVVERGRVALQTIKDQIDLVVRQILELGEKSKQIGLVLDLVNELAEQTNILAVNATIEAAGAGESGRRFAAVAAEIRKLSDRVSEATRSIRTLVEGIRASVNANVLATEKGQKSVDAGVAEFFSVSQAFSLISNAVNTMAQAGKEIELTTRQQTTALEQLSLGFMDSQQTAKEIEASTAQTAQTAAMLTDLSKKLQRLVQSQARG